VTPTPSPRGRFIVLEGGDGVGKSTQRALLGQWLEERGYEVVLTREPGGTELGDLVRSALLHGGHVDARTEALLFATDRAHHVHTVVRPALERGAMVVSDRYLDSSAAYQGAARELGMDEVRDLSLWATNHLLPDLTIVLDLDPEVAVARREGAPDRLERESLDFHRRVRAGFLLLAAADPARYLVLDATRDPRELHAAIAGRVGELVGAP